MSDPMNPAAIGVDKLSRRLRKVSGVLSLHAAYAEPVATVIALVESDEARKIAMDVEMDVLGKTGEYPVDFLVYRIDPNEASLRQASLQGFQLRWKRK
jgi:hypothetical protein